jgi:hypothetical protein
MSIGVKRKAQENILDRVKTLTADLSTALTGNSPTTVQLATELKPELDSSARTPRGKKGKHQLERKSHYVRRRVDALRQLLLRPGFRWVAVPSGNILLDATVSFLFLSHLRERASSCTRKGR